MRKIINFDSYTDFVNFIKDKISTKQIGNGSEGVCYISKDEESAYKIVFCPAIGYNIDKIITTNDIDVELSHYLLPQEVYVLNNYTLLGYKTKNIKERNLFENTNLIKDDYNLNQIDFEVLITAYHKILKETELLSDKNILIYDLVGNLYFTGNHFYGIDTCGYKKVATDVHETNKEKLEEALKEIFSTYLMFHEEEYCDTPDNIHEETNMQNYIKKLSRIIKK